MDKLLTMVEDKRSAQGLYGDVLGMAWARIADEQGVDDMLILNYVYNVIDKTTGRN